MTHDHEPGPPPASFPPHSSASRRLDPKRLYPALIFIPLFYVVVRYVDPVVFYVLITVVALLAFAEFHQLFFSTTPSKSGLFTGLFLITVLLATMQWPIMDSSYPVIAFILLGIMIHQLSASHRISHTATTAPWFSAPILTFGVLYVGFTLGFLLLTRQLEHGVFLIFYVLLITWAGDTGGYYIGKLYGQRPLAPVLSPNKTIEGLLGGLGLALLCAIIAHWWFLPQLTLVDCLITAVLLTGMGVLGDLSESVFKRGAGIKDSGALIPGHGGMLDRIDSLLFTGPTFYYYVTLVKDFTPSS